MARRKPFEDRDVESVSANDPARYLTTQSKSGVTTLYLIRHAESAPDFSIAESDWPLSPNGTMQAQRLASQLATLGADALISSPYRRAVETLEPYARQIGLPIRIEADLRERSVHDGFVENRDELMRKLWADLDASMPNCESGTQCRTRVTNCLTRVADEHVGGTVFVASHGNAIALFLNGIDASFGYDRWKALGNPAVLCVRRLKKEWQWDRNHEFGASC